MFFKSSDIKLRRNNKIVWLFVKILSINLVCLDLQPMSFHISRTINIHNFNMVFLLDATFDLLVRFWKPIVGCHDGRGTEKRAGHQQPSGEDEKEPRGFGEGPAAPSG